MFSANFTFGDSSLVKVGSLNRKFMPISTDGSIFAFWFVGCHTMAFAAYSISFGIDSGVVHSVFMTIYAMTFIASGPYISRDFVSIIFRAKDTDSIGIIAETNIISRQRVPIYAMTLANISGPSTHAAEHILSWCYDLEMIWIDATRIATKMIQMHTSWYYNTANKFIRKAMGKQSFFVKPNDAVAPSFRSSGPNPTIFGLNYFAPKTLFIDYLGGHLFCPYEKRGN